MTSGAASGKRLLLTNGSGFVGTHLIRRLLDQGHSVVAWHIDELTEAQLGWAVEWHRVDITDEVRVSSMLKQSDAEAVVHLAAISDVPTAIRKPAMTWSINVLGTLNLLAAVSQHRPECRILYIGSGDAYGESFNHDGIVSESSPLLPQNPYSASKAAAELAVQEFARRGAVQAICTRPFNHIGPGQSIRFAIPSFSHQIASIEAGHSDAVLRVGNLEAERDFTDVRDVVQAYSRLLDCPAEVYDGRSLNICSGRARSMQSVLDELLHLSECDIRIETDPERLRPSDTPRIVGSHERLNQLTGWSPELSISQTLNDALNEARALVESGPNARH